MGKAYYYTSATLPMLHYDSALSVSREDFLDICRRTMDKSDYASLETCSIGPAEGESDPAGLAGRYGRWETALRNALVRLRAKEQGLDEREFLRPGGEGFGVDEIAQAAVKTDSPLEAEHLLNRARWAFVDELSAGHIMDLEYLMGYYLQLQILERKESFREEEGFANYKKLYDDILSVRKGDAGNEVTE